MTNEYKVALIPDDSRIVINIGLSDKNPKLFEGAKVKVFQYGEEIIDPSTKDSLGLYILTKEKLEITDIEEKYSIARKITTEKVNSIFSVASPMLKERERTYVKTLSVSEEDLSSTDIVDKQIKIGDLVKFID